jgi:hypothetical protein
LLAFVVLGPFALILVWKSRGMSRPGKAVVAALILVYTGYCVYFAYKIMAMELRYFEQFNDVMRGIGPR